MPTLLGFGFGGPMDMLIIGGIMLLLFGNRLPSVMRSLGEGIVEFKKGVNGVPEDEPTKKIDRDESAPSGNTETKTTVEQKQEVH